MIGIFDSGIGGLSVFKEIRKVLPEEGYIYYSDNANCPYGEKSRQFIIDRARAITRLLIEEGAGLIVVACNTATAAAIAPLRDEFPVKFIGMEPAIKPAAALTGTGTVGVLATAGTLKADKYQSTREKYSDGIRIVEHVGQGFVELVEKGETTGKTAEETVFSSIAPLLDAGADVIVLGCTHYPFLSGTISKVAAEYCPDRKITVIDPAPAVARHLARVAQEEGLISNEGFSMKLMASGDDRVLLDTYGRLL